MVTWFKRLAQVLPPSFEHFQIGELSQWSRRLNTPLWGQMGSVFKQAEQGHYKPSMCWIRHWVPRGRDKIFYSSLNFVSFPV